MNNSKIFIFTILHSKIILKRTLMASFCETFYLINIYKNITKKDSKKYTVNIGEILRWTDGCYYK